MTLLPVKLLSVFLLGLVVAAGFGGDSSSILNFSPTFVWIIWWVGMSITVALVGNIWALLNPWKIVFGWAEGVYRLARPGQNLSLGLEYPAKFGIWPALVLFGLFTWIQDAYPKTDVPTQIAIMVVVYSVITLGGMLVFGRHQWLRKGEAFTVVFGLLTRFSVTEVRVNDQGSCQVCSADCRDLDAECIDCYECFQRSSDREINLRPFAIGLGRNEPVAKAAGSGRSRRGGNPGLELLDQHRVSRVESEGLPPIGTGLVEVVQAGMDVTQVVLDGGIIRNAGVRGFDIGKGLLVRSLLIINPATGIEEGSVTGRLL